MKKGSGERRSVPLPDKLPLCTQWAADGECEKNPVFMKLECASSCTTQGAPPQDKSDKCKKWAELGECADPRCGCFRQTQPKARQAFREALLSRVSRAKRYVTVGSGGLLYDLELLLSLQQLFPKSKPCHDRCQATR